jgi:antitoxin component YwqK of YwqJK toxin-antitoxin module
MSKKQFCVVGFVMLAVLISACTKTEKQYYEDGTIKSEVVKKHGKKEGPARYYHANGKIQQETFYKEDELEGLSRRWHFNGSLELEENYKQGLKNGKASGYTKKGKLIWQAYYVRDTLNGPWEEFHENGTPKVQGYYKMGLYDKVWRYFDFNNQQVGEGRFSDGSGFQRAYYPDGTKWREIPYKQNKKHGKERWWFPDGKLQKEKEYVFDSLLIVRDYQKPIR